MDIPRQQATLLFALASVLSGLNTTLLMPAAYHPGAGLFTQALPFVLLALVLGLIAAGAKVWRAGLRSGR